MLLPCPPYASAQEALLLFLCAVLCLHSQSCISTC